MTDAKKTPREQLAEKHAAELARLDREEALAAAIPESFTPYKMLHASSLNWLSVRYEPATLGAAFEVFKQYADAGFLLPSVYYVNTYRHWEPMAMVDARKNRKEYEGAKKELETVAEIRVHQAYASFGTVTLSFWVDLPTVGAVEIDCEIGGHRPPHRLQMRPVLVSAGARGREDARVMRWDEPSALSAHAHERARAGTGDKQTVDAYFYWCFDDWKHEFTGAIDAICRDIGEPGLNPEGE